MSLFNVFDVAGSGMSAQSVRLNVTSSNLANAESVSGSPATAYRARHPVFTAVLNSAMGDEAGSSVAVRVLDIVQNRTPAQGRYEPGNPLADKQGYVYLSNVNAVEEMANMISASRSYQSNVEVLNSVKQLMLRTLTIGQ
ncbi:MAG: flagellar basal body rod protein FlgC [Gammaproteobacteria bacterium]|nr:MAG: flagellar basal body rod protein FlgC [Gammaproteobacteria bacterium]